mmetsp:Transcript_65432/g.109623  ORF Transcript_65432/g.109623 Transcript_65432/m.109623 type:complete len:256 (-) Transcript_65432:506-1273(-)
MMGMMCTLVATTATVMQPGGTLMNLERRSLTTHTTRRHGTTAGTSGTTMMTTLGAPGATALRTKNTSTPGAHTGTATHTWTSPGPTIATPSTLRMIQNTPVALRRTAGPPPHVSGHPESRRSRGVLPPCGLTGLGGTGLRSRIGCGCMKMTKSAVRSWRSPAKRSCRTRRRSCPACGRRPTAAAVSRRPVMSLRGPPTFCTRERGTADRMTTRISHGSTTGTTAMCRAGTRPPATTPRRGACRLRSRHLCPANRP